MRELMCDRIDFENEDNVKAIEAFAEAIQEDDGQRVAFTYTGNVHGMDDRLWAMVDTEDGTGSRKMVISATFPSVHYARAQGYDAQNYQPVGAVNIYTGILGYYSNANTMDEAALTATELDEAVSEWYLRSNNNEKNMLDAFKQECMEVAQKARKTFDNRHKKVLHQLYG